MQFKLMRKNTTPKAKLIQQINTPQEHELQTHKSRFKKVSDSKE